MTSREGQFYSAEFTAVVGAIGYGTAIPDSAGLTHTVFRKPNDLNALMGFAIESSALVLTDH